MADDSSQERTQQATPKRRQQAREKGQIPRSKELNVAFLLLSSGISLVIIGPNIYQAFADIMQHSFVVTRDNATSTGYIFEVVRNDVKLIVKALLPFFIVVFITALCTPMLLGGFIFSTKSLAPKFERINPLKGIKRIFSLNSIVELVKAIIKFLIIGLVVFLFVKYNYKTLFQLYDFELPVAMQQAKNLLSGNFIFICFSLLFVASLDIPYQLWQHHSKLKMTTQEIKEESKESEASPEVKKRIRSNQQRISQNRMIQEIPKADVIITNPTHFAVALRYQTAIDAAPTVIAKGGDHMAHQIINLAKQHKIEVLSSPALARSIYFSTELYAEIPAGLYRAVAQVLAYIYQLKRFKSGLGQKPDTLGDLNIPDEFKVDLETG